MGFQLTKDQQEAVDNRGGGLLVSAAAGSGKTRVLVERLLARVEAGEDIDRFLIITYTKAAAAELRERVASALSDRLAADPADRHLRRQANLVYKTQISTIHAFCSQLLREEGHRLDLDGDFRLCDENEALLIMAQCLDQVLDSRYEHLEEGSDFVQVVDTMSAGRDDTRLMQIVLDIRSRIQSHPDPGGWLDGQERVWALVGVTDGGETAWGRLLLDDAAAQAGYWVQRLAELCELAQEDPKLVKGYVPSIRDTMDSLEQFIEAAGQGWDRAAACSDIDFPRLGSVRGCESEQAKEWIKQVRDQCKKRMKKLGEIFSGTSEELLDDMRAVCPAIRGLFALVRDFEAAYSAEKARRSIVDFSDLEHMAVQLMVGADGQPTELARRWSQRYDEIMVDEYQDTNAVQNAIFQALSRDGTNLFMVGDVKQSIYRFRLADPTIFLEKYRSFAPCESAEEGQPRRVLLSQNFRSRPQVLEGTNYVFRSLMSERFGEMAYTDDEALVPGGSFPGDGADYALELDLLDCSAADEEEGSEKPSRDQQEAAFVARRIRQLLDDRFLVAIDQTDTRPVRPEDIVVLLRSPNTVLHHYAAALGRLDIPWQAEGGGSFFESTEIQTAISILRIIDNPRQDVALIAAMRSAVYGFSADRLAQIRTNAPNEDFYTALTLDQGEDARAFLAELNALRRQAGEVSCQQLVWRVFEETNLLGVYGAMDEGEIRRGNLLLLAQLARDFEASGHRGLFSFAAHLQSLEETEGKLPRPAAGGGGVRIMSIHRSKGLEFPVVILAGLARQLNRQDMTRPILFHPKLGVGPKRLDLERRLEYPTLARQAVALQMDYEMSAEELRLLYVAMTRAKEKLILSCALTGGERDLEKLILDAGSPVEPQALHQCASPAQWVLLAALARPEAGSLPVSGFVPAGGVEFGPAWDIRWVELSAEGEIAVPTETVQPEQEESGGAPDLSARFGWQYPYAEDVDLPSKLTATQLKGRGLDQEAGQDAPAQPEWKREFHFDRPRFAAEELGLTPTQRGTALHLAMQYIDFARCGSVAQVAEEVARLVREEYLTPAQGEAAAPEKIFAFFDCPLGREALAADSLRREFKFSILAPARNYFPQAGETEQVLLQGVVDCFFDGPEGLTVIDFKSDHVRGEALRRRAEGYRPQLQAYARALAEITGRPIHRTALWFFETGETVEL